MVSDVRNFSYCILNNLTGDGYVPLPTLRWSEVLVYGIETCAGADSRQGIFQARTNGVKTTESRIVAKPRTLVASPVGVNHRCPRRITSQTQHIFDDVRTAHKATESHAHRGLAITFDVPGHAYSWLKALVICLPQ